MSKPTLVQSLLNRPSQSYSYPAKKEYYSNRQEMMRLATSAAVGTEQAAQSLGRTLQSVAPSTPATTPKPTAYSRESPSSAPLKPNPKISSAKSTLSTSSSRPSSTSSRPNSTTTATSQPARPQKSPQLQAVRLKPRLSYVDRCDSDSDSEGDQSNLEAYFTPNTSPRTSMASSNVPFPSGSTRRKSSRKSLRGDDKGDTRAPSGASTPRIVAVPSTRTPSGSSDKTRALHSLSINSSLSSNSLGAHSMFSDYVGSKEPTPMTTPIHSDDGRLGKGATPQPSNKSTSTSTAATTTSTSTAAKGKPSRPANGMANEEWAKDVRWLVPPGGSDPKRRNNNNNNGTFDSTKVKATNGSASPPQSGSTVTKTPARKQNLGDTLGLSPPAHVPSSKGKEKEGQAARSRQANHGSVSAKPAAAPTKFAPHTFSAFAPIATSSPPATINKPHPANVPSPEPAQSSQMPISLPPPPNQRKKPAHSKPVTMPNMSALVEEDEDAPFTPRMEGHDLVWSGESNGSSLGRNRTLRHTSGSKTRPELHRRRSRSLESASSHSGSGSGSTSTLRKQPKTLTSEVQALTLATPGELPSKGTQGYTSLVLPRAPPPTSTQTLPQNDGWGRWFSSVSNMTDGKVDLTRTGVAQTTMASVEVVRGLGATRKGSLSGVLNVLAAGRRKLSGSGPGPAPIPLPVNGGRRASRDGAPPAVPPPNGSGAEGTILGFTSYRKPPSYVPSTGVLVQVWAVGVDEIDGRLVGVRFGAGERTEGILGDDQEVEEPEEMQTEDEQPRVAPDESQDEDAAPTRRRGLAGLGRTLSMRGRMMLSRSGSSGGQSQTAPQRSASARQTPPQISPPQPHQRSTSFNLRRNNTTVSTATTRTNASGASQLQRNSSTSSDAGRKKKQSYAKVGYIPGRSFVGRVLECGWEVKDEVVHKGDWVVGLLDVRKCGALAEFIVVDRRRVHRVPHPRQAPSKFETPSQMPIPIWAASPTSPQGGTNPSTLTLEELALLPLCGLPAYRAVRTFMFAFSSARDGSSTPAAVDLRAGVEFGTGGAIAGPSTGHGFAPMPSARITTDPAYGLRRQRRALVLRGHDGPGAMAVQMLVQQGWQVSVHVPLSALPPYATYDQEEAYKTSAEERARMWGADEVIFDDGEVGDNDGRGAAVRVLENLNEEGDVFDAILDTIGGKEIREAGEELLRSPGIATSPTLSGERLASPTRVVTKQTQFTTLVGDVPERTIPSARDNFRAGFRSLRRGSSDAAAGLTGSSRKNSEDSEGKAGAKVGYAWVSVAQDVDWEGEGVSETLGTVSQMALEDGVRPWVGEADGRELARPRVVPFGKAPRAFVEGGPLGDGGTVVVKVVG